MSDQPWGPQVPASEDTRWLFWLPSENNPICECAGNYKCCPCTLKDAVAEIARLRSENERLREAFDQLIEVMRAIKSMQIELEPHGHVYLVQRMKSAAGEAFASAERARAALGLKAGEAERRTET